ncbi:MAG: hypothetical protein JO180_08270 [Gemmatirosa sp.]|nr:hypothetical protein [Gemmatirosa sp.]
MRVDAIVALAQAAHRSHWLMTGQVSEGDTRAALVTARWQEAAVAQFGQDVVPEFPIGEGLRERIDLVDRSERVAYELKVSPNNTHFEFYRDIFKVIIARDNALPGLNHFVFLTPVQGAKTLERAFARAVIEHAGSLNLLVEVRGI